MGDVKAEGSVYKRCSCRDDRGGKLGARCLRLRRSGGAWSPTHGRWGYLLYPVFVLILRRGEAVGLRDTDLDLESGIALIAQQITTCGRATITKKVEADAGARTLALDHTTVPVLGATTRGAPGGGWPAARRGRTPGWFSCNPAGQPWHRDTVRDRFDRLVAASGLPPIRHARPAPLRRDLPQAGGADLKDIEPRRPPWQGAASHRCS
jgi:integrase